MAGGRTGGRTHLQLRHARRARFGSRSPDMVVYDDGREKLHDRGPSGGWLVLVEGTAVCGECGGVAGGRYQVARYGYPTN